MKKQGTLPLKLRDFIKDLGFPSFTSWPYKKTLFVLNRYCEIKLAEQSDKWIFPDVEGLIKTMCEIEKSCNNIQVEGKIDFKELFQRKPACFLSDFKSDIWFLPLLAERKPSSWQKLLHAHNRMIFYRDDERKFDSNMRDFISRIEQFEENFFPDKVYESSSFNHEDPFNPGRKVDIAKKLYPSIASTKPSMETLIEQARPAQRIGFGLESSFKSKKLDSRSVVIDANTKSAKDKNKHILYAAGWSVNGAFDDGDA